MENRFSFEAAGIPVSLLLPEEYFQAVVNYLLPFESEQMCSDSTFTIHLLRELPYPERSVYRTDHFYREANEKEFTVGDKRFIQHISLTDRSSILQINISSAQNPLSIINKALMFFLSLLVIENGGLTLHSSASHRDGKSLLFLGKSEAGKSTICTLMSPGWKRGSDEFNIVKIKDSEVFSYPTPFVSTAGRCEVMSGSKLERIFLLEKCTQNRFELLQYKTALFSLLANVYTKPASEYVAQRVFDNAQAIAGRVQCGRLSFVKNNQVCTFIEEDLLDEN